MRRIIILAASLACAAPAFAQTSPLGAWARGDGNARVRVERCGGAFCAINTWIKDTSEGEQVGHKLVMNVNPTGEGTYSGSAFDPQRDRTYGMTMTVRGDSMTTRGCIVKVLCKSMQWSRIR
jgi:uncharacterized protein (DUF2147 family)